jgi:phosphoribosylglycinamide formyltransferase-1
MADHRSETGEVSVVILTGSETRHIFMRKALAVDRRLRVLKTYCEGLEKSLENLVESSGGEKKLRLVHLEQRLNSEADFFNVFVALCPDFSQPVALPKGEINHPTYAKDITDLAPEVIAAYGCSIIREPLLSLFPRRFINVHLGLSPYYRGSGTNFWPLVEGKPEYVGATFMYIDSGIDTGEIIHQIRARIFPGDTPHQIGNRLIADIALVYPDVIAKHSKLSLITPNSDSGCFVRKTDFSEESVLELHRQFASGLVDRYLAELDSRCRQVPIVSHPDIATVSDLLAEEL